MTLGQQHGQNPLSLPDNILVKHSASQFISEDAFKSHVLNWITSAACYQELVYTSVSQPWGTGLVPHLNEVLEARPVRESYNSSTSVLRMRVMPTEIQDCHQRWYSAQKARWLLSGRLTLPEHDHLGDQVGTTIEILQPPYAGSRKEPDLLIRPDGVQLPTVVMESGWPETLTQLQNDINLCLVGGAGGTNAVILLKWAKISPSTRVRGDVELYTLDSQGVPRLRQTEAIFPAPAPGAPSQRIRITRRQFFGSTLSRFQGRNREDGFSLDLNLLRGVAVAALNRMGLVPA